MEYLSGRKIMEIRKERDLVIMRKRFVLLLVLMLLVSLSACTQNNGGDPNPDPPELTTLAGIALGDPVTKVTELYGTDYEEDFLDAEDSYYGEDVANWNYQDRIYFTIGQTSQSVLRVYVTVPDYETNLEVKVGDSADTFLSVYREYYEELISFHSDDTLYGWFQVEEGGLLIFRFADENGPIESIDPIPDEAVVESITLAYLDHFD
jgi:hypothetical protein